MNPTVRPATAEDEDAVHRLDRETWSWDVSPSSPVPEGAPFFGAGRKPEDVLVAVVGDEVVGYTKLGFSLPVESSRHVLEIQGLSVDPAHSRRGIGRLLVMAAIREATARGARKLTLRVLGSNAPARALYDACGCHVEGVLREQFFLAGRYVDDVLMAITLDRHLGV